MVRFPDWGLQKISLCNVIVDNVLNLRQKNLIVKLSNSHLPAISRQSLSVLIYTQIHSIVIIKDFFQGFLLMNLVDSKKARHTANDNLINFVFVQKEWFKFENDFYKVLNTFSLFILKLDFCGKFVDPVINVFN
jgi:hypothetical protein